MTVTHILGAGVSIVSTRSVWGRRRDYVALPEVKVQKPQGVTFFDFASGGAAVAIVRIAIVAFFRGFFDAISTFVTAIRIKLTGILMGRTITQKVAGVFGALQTFAGLAGKIRRYAWGGIRIARIALLPVIFLAIPADGLLLCK